MIGGNIMLFNEYALAVEIEYSLFEIFDILYIPKDTEVDLRYKAATSYGAHGVYAPISSGFAIGDTFENNTVVHNLESESVNISDDQNAYLFISDNKIFGVTINQKLDFADKKYQAAFESNVILIDTSLENKANIGDLWDGQKIIPMV